MPTSGVNRSAPYSKMGAITELASLWYTYGARPAPGGLRQLIRAKAPWVKAPWVKARWCEKWVGVLRAGINV